MAQKTEAILSAEIKEALRACVYIDLAAVKPYVQSCVLSASRKLKKITGNEFRVCLRDENADWKI
ncbi:hypothetical protein TcasGA2_TC008252 [Tribolium castaneum]|uniref:Uncharacterized protein n=1 Tax=Tribolium castaneum TaxID=7070 RepID=D2A0Q3_TRICA|nr:hypothetical protein TcasGA2_TC008252 [Tribolium castaneum]